MNYKEGAMAAPETTTLDIRLKVEISLADSMEDMLRITKLFVRDLHEAVEGHQAKLLFYIGTKQYTNRS